MKPDYEKAATKAIETLIKHKISSAPVSPLPILKSLDGVFVVTYDAMSEASGQDRQCVISMFGEKNQDAFTTVMMVEDKPRYLVTYNQHLSANLAQRALARELGHIVLGHDGSLPEDVRNEEAKCFANHLLCPRPMIYSIKALGIRVTTEVFGSLTGCYDHCLACMRRLPAVHVDPALNRMVKDQFTDYIVNFFHFYRSILLHSDGAAVADFGTFMDGYEE